MENNMQTDNTTAVQTAIDLACVFASPLLNSGQQRLGQLAIDVSLTVFSRMVLTDDADNATKIQALKSYLSNSSGWDNYKQDFYNFLATKRFDNLKTLLLENKVVWQGMEDSLPLIAAQWAQSAIWGVRFVQDVVSPKSNAPKQALYALLESPPQDFYETFFYGKAVRAVEDSCRIVAKAQRMNQDLLNDIAANKFLSVSEVQAKIQERRKEVQALGGKHNIPPGVE